jgi:glutaredoxin
MLTLYDYPDCPFCQKVRVVLAEKDLEYEKIFVDLRKQEQKLPDFLRLNPYGKVPVLVDEDEVIYDSTIINDTWKRNIRPRLMPRILKGARVVSRITDNPSFRRPPCCSRSCAVDAERDGRVVEQDEELRRNLYFARPPGGWEFLVGRNSPWLMHHSRHGSWCSVGRTS